jgi:prepilin-type N-terminal cleavage/methylation domain-containing protein
MNYKSQNGLTLLELSVVLLILTALAGMAVPYMNSTQDIVREQITKDRALAIKNAIIKVDTINGVPTTTGFVVDVGRLPYTISELTDGKDCSTASQPQFNCTNTIENWKGPYLNSIDSGFFDGWGTHNVNEEIENPNNFGWGFTLSNENTLLEIKSLAPQSEVKTFIYPNDWSINLTNTSSITVNLIPSPGYCQSNSSNINNIILPIPDQTTCLHLPGIWSINTCSIKEITKEEQCTSAATWKAFNPSPENPLSTIIVINDIILTTTDTITSSQTQSLHFSTTPDQSQPILLPAGQRNIEIFITDEKLNFNTNKPEIINGNLSIEKLTGNKVIFIPYRSKKYLSIPRYIQTFNWN